MQYAKVQAQQRQSKDPRKVHKFDIEKNLTNKFERRRYWTMSGQVASVITMKQRKRRKNNNN